MFKSKLAAIIIYLLGSQLISCDVKELNKVEVNYNQIDELEAAQKRTFTQKLIRYIGRKPEDASHENKFHAYFDDFYENQVNQHDLVAYSQKGDTTFFVFTRIAPSVHLKKVAIGGYVQWQDNESILSIEEVFRTWKLVPDTLQQRIDLLFSKMVNGESLAPYYTENIGNTEYIEFPNNEVWYDKKLQRWMSDREDVLSTFVQAKIDRTKERILEFEAAQAEDTIN